MCTRCHILTSREVFGGGLGPFAVVLGSLLYDCYMTWVGGDHAKIAEGNAVRQVGEGLIRV